MTAKLTADLIIRQLRFSSDRIGCDVDSWPVEIFSGRSRNQIVICGTHIETSMDWQVEFSASELAPELGEGGGVFGMIALRVLHKQRQLEAHLYTR